MKETATYLVPITVITVIFRWLVVYQQAVPVTFVVEMPVNAVVLGGILRHIFVVHRLKIHHLVLSNGFNKKHHI